jgi:hypothetical protein
MMPEESMPVCIRRVHIANGCSSCCAFLQVNASTTRPSIRCGRRQCFEEQAALRTTASMHHLA